MSEPSNTRRVYNSLPIKPRRGGRAPRQQKSFVWHYFDRTAGDTAKCRVCRHQVILKRGNTSCMISHLKHIHGLKSREIVSLNSLPTLSKRKSTTAAELRERVFGRFQEISGGGIWRCVICAYAFQSREFRPMYQHLKSTHWKTGAIDIDDMITKIKTECSDDLPEETMDDSNMNNETNDIRHILEPSIKIKINLPDGNEVDGFVVGGTDESEENPRSKTAVNLDHNYHDESRTVSPNFEEGQSTSRVTEALEDDTLDPQVPIPDERRKFDHQYSRESRRNPAASSKRKRTYNQRKLPAKRNNARKKSKARPRGKSIKQTNPEPTEFGISGTHSVFRYTGDMAENEIEEDEEEFDIQVPLQNLPAIMEKPKCGRDGKSKRSRYVPSTSTYSFCSTPYFVPLSNSRSCEVRLYFDINNWVSGLP